MALEALRETLLARNDEMRGALGVSLRIDFFLDPALYQRRLAENRSDPATLAKLFLLCSPVAHDDAVRALTPVEPALRAETGLAALDETSSGRWSGSRSMRTSSSRRIRSRGHSPLIS